MSTVLALGVFDLFHVGHLNYLQSAAAYGDKLVVGVQDSRSVRAQKGSEPIVSTVDRMAIIRALKCVDFVFSYMNVNQSALLHHLKPSILAVSEEYGHTDEQQATIRTCKEMGIELHIVPRYAGISSTDIRKSVMDFWNRRKGSTMLTSCQNNHKKQRNETKKELALIRQWCRPGHLLDLGCGDGRLLIPLVKDFTTSVGVESSFLLHRKLQAKLIHNHNVKIVLEPAETFTCGCRFNTILMSGLLPYLNDTQLSQLMTHLRKLTTTNARILVRTSVALGKRLDIVDLFSEQLNTFYTATYRTEKETAGILQGAGFQCIHHEELYANHADTSVNFLVFEH